MPPVIPPSRSRSLRKTTNNNHVDSKETIATKISSTATAITSKAPAKGTRWSASLDISPSRLPVKPQRSSTEIPSQPRLTRTGSISATSTYQAPPRNTGFESTNSNTQIKAQPVTSRRDTSFRQRDGPRPLSTINNQPLQHISAIDCRTTHTKHPSHARTHSNSTIHSRSNSSTKITQGTSAIAVASHPHPTRAVSVLQPKKPLFSTHQQHYTPAKNLAPKLHHAAFLAPPTPSKWPANKAISAEISKLQNELLQLHLLHNDVARVEKEWRESAQKKLASRFHSVVEKKRQVGQLECQENVRQNTQTLKKWLKVGAQGWGLEEKLQILDEITTGIFSLGEAGGRYARVIHSFEQWLEECQTVWDNRICPDNRADETDVFIVELEPTWKDDCFSLRRKLDVWNERNKDLGVPDIHSSLGKVIIQVDSIVTGMITELRLISRIEQEIMHMEHDWILHQNRNGANDEDPTEEISPAAGAIWRTY